LAASEKKGPPFRVLVAEYLLANSNAASSVLPSMLVEAEAMLMAVLTDFAALPGVRATVMLSEDSAQRLAGSDNSNSKSAISSRQESKPGSRGWTELAKEAPGVLSFLVPTPATPELSCASGLARSPYVLCGELDRQTLSRILHTQSADSAFDAVFLISPECDGVLVSLLKAIQTHDQSHIHCLNLDWQLTEIFADKRRTAAWLQQRGIPTIPTRTIDDATVEFLRSATPCALDYRVVLKPRDGAGAESIQIVPLNREFETLPQQDSDNDRWLLQPLMPGLACSVGFIGGGPDEPTTILPAARQQIHSTDGRLTYHGGQVPCESAIADCIMPVAEQLAAAIGPFSGYVGADLLVDLSAVEKSPASVLVVEINPRLCTSYVGYRALTADNLAAWLLQQNHGRTIRWTSQVVTFSASGEITRPGE